MTLFVKVIVALALASANADFLKPRESYEAQFFEHCKKYGLTFESGLEYVKRLEIFAAKDDEIVTHNAGDHKFWLGHNSFSHLTWEEFQARFNLGKEMKIAKRGTAVHTESTLPGALHKDWSVLGKVTPVKNQGSCGSCWSFSTTGSLEGAYAIANGLNVTEWEGFSEQMLVSCDTDDDGCNGGLMDTAFEWIMNNDGICSEEDYPYTSGGGADGVCKATACSVVRGSTPVNYVDVTPGSSAALESAITQQPVSVAIQANQVAFQSYSGGVLTERCGNNLDHGVLAVGYGTWTDDTTKYWKVKNSWGADWGMDGYILIEKGSSIDQCGILDAASYPNITKTLGPH